MPAALLLVEKELPIDAHKRFAGFMAAIAVSEA